LTANASSRARIINPFWRPLYKKIIRKEPKSIKVLRPSFISQADIRHDIISRIDYAMMEFPHAIGRQTNFELAACGGY
jgi:hypothetical protein